MAVEYTKEGNIGIICFNNPPLNIGDHVSNEQFTAALEQIEADEEVHVAVIHAIGRAFGAGSNMFEIADYLDRLTDEEYLQVKMVPGFDRSLYITDLRVPVICAVDAPAYQGAMETALACDFIVASVNASFQMTGVNIGTFPGVNGVTRLVECMGPRKTLEYLLAGEPVSAEKAYEMGIVSRLAREGTALDMAMDWAREIAAKPPLGVWCNKAAVVGVTKDRNEYLREMTMDIHRKVIAAGSLRQGCAEFRAKQEAKKKARAAAEQAEPAHE